MLTLSRRILREASFAFVLAFLALTLIVLVGQAYQMLRHLEGLGGAVLVRLLPYTIPLTAKITVPLAVLVACAITCTRLLADNEITAMRASGIPLWRVTWPLLAAGGVLAAGLWVNNDRLAPAAAARLLAIREKAYLYLLRDLPDDAFSYTFDTPGFGAERGDPAGAGGVLAPRRRETFQYDGREGDEVLNLRIIGQEINYDRIRREAREGRTAASIVFAASAERARVRLDEASGELALETYNLEHTRYDPDQPDSEQRLFLPGWSFEVRRHLRDVWGRTPAVAEIATLSSSEIMDRVADRAPLQAAALPVPRLLAEWHARAAFALSPLLFAALGATLPLLLGARSRILSLGLSVVPAVLVYFTFAMLADSLAARPGSENAYLLHWAPDALTAAVAAAAGWRVLRR
ncbi:MAG: LptF/LptG family permease [Planctomycetes bacterium]|nr:LptF/LptG family permease [Planctomycetota bacterium]